MFDGCMLDACHYTILAASPRLFNHSSTFISFITVCSQLFVLSVKKLVFFLETINCVISRTWLTGCCTRAVQDSAPQ